MVTSIPFLIARLTDDHDFLKLKELANVHDGWSLDYNKNGIKIWSRAVPDATIKMVKVWAVFSEISSKDLYYTLMDPLYRKEWDTHMVVGYDIGYLNPNNGVSYYAASCPPLRSRDFVLQTSWLDKSSEHYILNHSVCHKDHPPRQGYIRAVSYFTGYFIKCVPNGGCEMCFVSQMDPQGIIPAWIVNKCTTIFAPRFVRHLEKAAYAYSTWKSQNSPNFLPWVHPEQMKSPKISIADCTPCEEEIQSSFFQYLVEKNRKLHAAHPLPDPGNSNHVPFSNVVAAGPSKVPNTTLETKGTQLMPTDSLQATNSAEKREKKTRPYNPRKEILGKSRKTFEILEAIEQEEEKRNINYQKK